MTGDKGIVVRLIGLGKAGDPAVLAKGGEAVPPPGDDLVGIALMSNIENQPVLCRVIDPVDGYGELNGAEVGGQMPAGAGNAVHLKTAQLRTQGLKLLAAQFFDIFR